jgi:hypothetical protein
VPGETKLTKWVDALALEESGFHFVSPGTIEDLNALRRADEEKYDNGSWRAQVCQSLDPVLE